MKLTEDAHPRLVLSSTPPVSVMFEGAFYLGRFLFCGIIFSDTVKHVTR